jgi:hypothetical protein
MAERLSSGNGDTSVGSLVGIKLKLDFHFRGAMVC